MKFRGGRVVVVRVMVCWRRRIGTCWEAGMSEYGSTLPRRQLGRYLRNGREECGLTLHQAAALIQRSASTLQRIEHGMVAQLR